VNVNLNSKEFVVLRSDQPAFYTDKYCMYKGNNFASRINQQKCLRFASKETAQNK